MVRLEEIAEKLECDPSSVTQEDYDDVEEISENIVMFLDENPGIDRKSFMLGFTLANINAIVGLLKTATGELQYESQMALREISEPKEVNHNDIELEERENPWPLRGEKP